MLYHDYQTFTHSANVSYYCIMLCKALGLSDREDLLKIAKGGLLHDLGKLDIPEAILTKPDKLTDKEFEIIKRHPTVGFRKLCRREDMDFGQLMMVYQHHERIDGKGYPDGLSGADIPLLTRVLSVADVYDALASERPYRAALPHAKCLLFLRENAAGGGLDPELVHCFCQDRVVPFDSSTTLRNPARSSRLPEPRGTISWISVPSSRSDATSRWSRCR